MSRFDTPLFDIDAWRERMDGRWFDSGAQLAEAGAVDLVAIEDDLVSAHVKGGELYVVTLRAPDGEGACTCPGFEKFGACKHQAAVVVAANLLDTTGVRSVRDRWARLRDGLLLDSREILVDRVMSMALKYPEILNEIEENIIADIKSVSNGNHLLDIDLAKINSDFENEENDNILRPAYLSESLDAKLSELEAAASALLHGEIGHNRPPEQMGIDKALAHDQVEKVFPATAVIKAEIASDDPNLEVVVDAGRQLQELGKWLSQKLNTAADEMAKTVGKSIGGVAVLAVGVTMANGWENLLKCLKIVIGALVAWMAAS